MNRIVSDLVSLANEGDRVDISAYQGDRDANEWNGKASAFLMSALGDGFAEDFIRIVGPDPWSEHGRRIGHLRGLAAALDKREGPFDLAAGLIRPLPPGPSSRKVFVVHGHDGEAKSVVARFLERLKLEPIILHEQATAGRTIIEKFEVYSEDIAFAVVLLTPDDIGAPLAAGRDGTKPRARQNVIMELGYFMGKLGRSNVCALYKGGVELPSDYQGVVYIEMDDQGAWRQKLAQELVQAKLQIELEGLLG